MRALLDVNVLIALLDSRHIHHRTAQRWLSKNINSGWASCPLTQNGLVRVLSQPTYPNPVTPADAMARLREASEAEWHEFWPDDISILASDNFVRTNVLGSRQVTDVYLLALAVAHGGRFATLDSHISIAAVSGASAEHLVIVG